MSSRWLAAAYYGLYFGAAGALLPYLNLFYQRAGMDTRQIGVLASLITLAMLFTGPLWGALADRFHLHRRLLPLSILMTLPPVLMLPTAHTFPALIALALWLSICLAPIIPLADNAVLSLLGDRRYEYGKLRLWGAVGWGLSAWLAGEVAQRVGVEYVFGLYAGLMLLCALVAARLPAPRLEATEPYWISLRRFTTDRRWWGFLAGALLFGLAMATVNNYYVLYVQSLGASDGLYGLSVAVAALSEIPIFFLSPLLLRVWQPRGLMRLAFVALAVRCFLYSLLGNPVWAVAIQLLHGPSFSAMWTAGVNYAGHLAPPGLGASAQAVFVATLYGLAGVIGALLGSQLYAAFGGAVLFRVAGAAALAGLAVFSVADVIAYRRRVSA